MKVEISSDMLVVLILKGLPSSFENFRCAIRSKDELPNTETLIGKILDEKRIRKTTEADNEDNALYAGDRRHKYHTPGKNKAKSKQP